MKMQRNSKIFKKLLSMLLRLWSYGRSCYSRKWNNTFTQISWFNNNKLI